MSKPSQAHLSRTIKKNQPVEMRQKTLRQMQYYIGAKLIEVGIDPQSVTYRWSVSDRQKEQVCTLSAFWGESLDKLLSGTEPLTGSELIDCARGNVSAEVKSVAKLCGYGSDVDGFQTALKETSRQMKLTSEQQAKLSRLMAE